jgi:hypothetical protein
MCVPAARAARSSARALRRSFGRAGSRRARRGDRSIAPAPIASIAVVAALLGAAGRIAAAEEPAPSGAPPAAPPPAAAAPEPTPAGSEAKAAAPRPMGITASLTGTTQYQDVEQRTAMLLAHVEYTRVSPWTFYARLGWVRDAQAGASSLSNALVGAWYAIALPRGVALSARGIAVVPVGTGGGDGADPGALRASLMATDWNGPLFAPNHLTGGAGLRLAYGRGAAFALLESTLYHARRVRGETVDPLGPTVTFTATKLGLGVATATGVSWLGGVAQTRYWGDPEFLGDRAAARDDHYAFVAVEAPIGLTRRPLRPGLLIARAIDAPKADLDFHLVEVSLAFSF